MNKILAISLVAAGSLRLASAASLTSPTLSQPIPDYANNGLSGLAENITFNHTGIQSVTDVQLTLDITGGFNGDYFAYLEHNNSMVVLLNRVGLNGQRPYGYDNGGFSQVTLSDTAANGIQTYQNEVNPGTGPLTGTWQPDQPLSGLNGGSADGAWTLFIADESQGGIGILTSWSLTVDGTATNVPEATGTMVLLAMGAGLLAVAHRRSLANSVRG